MRISARSLGLPLAATSLLLFLAPTASAVTIDWVTVGDRGNASDSPSSNCFAASCGSVSYEYYTSKYEVSNAQYAEFLNAKAKSDPLSLYNTTMGSDATNGGITRSGVSGSFTYAAKPGFESKPVNFVSFYDSLRFSNWLNNGQGSGDTETGAYTLLGGTTTPSNGSTVTRNAGASIFLTSENEWYKAAYYDAVSSSYFDYPTGSNTATICAAPTATANSANCNFAVGAVTIVGAYTGSASPYGTYDQGGNVHEWNEQKFVGGSGRGARGGALGNSASSLAASSTSYAVSTAEQATIGFRVASLIPEPSTGLLVMTGLLGMAGWRRRRA